MKKLTLFTLLGWIFFACSSPSHDLLITNVNVIDVVTGEVLPNRTVAIDGDEITAIYNKTIKPSKGTEVVDGTDKYLIPGLWDMHVHNNWNYEDTNDLMLANGITGAREMWGNMAILRKMIEERAAGKPIIDIYSAGVLTDGAPKIWPSSAEVTDPTAAEALVRCQVRAGADFIKVYSRLDSACFFTIGKTATELGVPFSGHVPEAVPIFDALAAGMLTSEHLYGLHQLGISEQENKQLDSLFEVGNQFEAFRRELKFFNSSVMKEKLQKSDLSKHWFSPTMVTMRGFRSMQDSVFTSDPRISYLPNYMTEDWKPRRTMGSQRMMPSLALMQQLYQNDFQILTILIESKAQIIAGTDYPNPWAFPGFSMHDELEIYVQAGMTPLQAIQTATLNPAKVMNNDRIGSVEKGRLASLVLLNSNPLEDINAVRDIESVILRGKIFNRVELDDMLANAKRKAALPDVMTLLGPMAEEGKLDELLDLLETKLDSLSEHYHLASLEYGLNGMGYQSMNGEKDAESAQEIFALNTRLFPHSQNVWDSYAECFLMQGDTTNAVEYYQKALDIYPCNQVIEKRLQVLKP
ncbi:amidohydrolase family protein [Mongoliitalea daihaiensis]|uniref:amidohydrolase family protein n=1 Tax=Mongoliitalea daihaiensis TaxID=2782006 RepID=UPI001F1F424D|nr:amidohydrolase family protein [Mongoliitalea daihaiensis]UJP63637.1 amidohydrolase family protein [Mongoliitalea daihaiensis]